MPPTTCGDLLDKSGEYIYKETMPTSPTLIYKYKRLIL
jgi:hypothetical protein